MGAGSVRVWVLYDASGALDEGFSLQYIRASLSGRKPGKYSVFEFEIDAADRSIMYHDPERHFEFDVTHEGRRYIATVANRASAFFGNKMTNNFLLTYD